MAEITVEKKTSFPTSGIVADRWYLKKAASDLLARLGFGNSTGTAVVRVETLFNTPKILSGSGTNSIDMSENICFQANLTGNITINFSTDPPSGVTGRFIFRIKQNDTTPYTVSWNTSGTTVIWQNNVEPLMSDGLDSVVIYSIYWDGANYFGYKTCGFEL